MKKLQFVAFPILVWACLSGLLQAQNESPFAKSNWKDNSKGNLAINPDQTYQEESRIEFQQDYFDHGIRSRSRQTLEPLPKRSKLW